MTYYITNKVKTTAAAGMATIVLMFVMALCSSQSAWGKAIGDTNDFIKGSDNEDTSNHFSVNLIPDSIQAFIKGKSYKASCTVPMEDLRYIRCLHVTAEGETKEGEMIVNKKIAKQVKEILYQLYIHRYPIESIRLIDHWDADDERSMRDNNSSAFNFRFISHTTKVSKHGLGMAVDINPLYNPCHKRLKNGKEVVEPANGRPYLNRSKTFKYKITADDLCCRLFKKYGFTWGGDWRSMKDYQHFEANF